MNSPKAYYRKLNRYKYQVKAVRFKSVERAAKPPKKPRDTKYHAP